MTTLDQRVAAAAELVAGVPAQEVAARLGVEVELVERWRELFVEGGRLRLAGRMEPSSFEARERFLTLVAHELRTPLAVIGGWVETLRDGNLAPAEADRALAVVAKQVEQLERTTRNALDAAAVARNQLRLAVSSFDLRHLVVEVLASLQEDPATIADGEPLVVAADRERLEQVTAEVVGHARRLAGSGPLRVAVVERTGSACVRVTTPGAEIGFEDAAALFEPYERADTSVGTGLGLYLSRALLAAHGGEIGLRSEPGGTELWFRLPTCGPAAGLRAERS